MKMVTKKELENQIEEYKVVVKNQIQEIKDKTNEVKSKTTLLGKQRDKILKQTQTLTSYQKIVENSKSETETKLKKKFDEQKELLNKLNMEIKEKELNLISPYDNLIRERVYLIVKSHSSAFMTKSRTLEIKDRIERNFKNTLSRKNIEKLICNALETRSYYGIIESIESGIMKLKIIDKTVKQGHYFYMFRTKDIIALKDYASFQADGE